MMIFLLQSKLAGKVALCAIVLFLSALLFSSCKKDEKKDEYKVMYSVTCSGKFKNGTPKVTYGDASGNSQTEEAGIGKTWMKEVSGSQTYPIKASVSGTFDSGEVEIYVEAYKNGNMVDVGVSSQSSTSEQDISVMYESTFE